MHVVEKPDAKSEFWLFPYNIEQRKQISTGTVHHQLRHASLWDILSTFLFSNHVAHTIEKALM